MIQNPESILGSWVKTCSVQAYGEPTEALGLAIETRIVPSPMSDIPLRGLNPKSSLDFGVVGGVGIKSKKRKKTTIRVECSLKTRRLSANF